MVSNKETKETNRISKIESSQSKNFSQVARFGQMSRLESWHSPTDNKWRDFGFGAKAYGNCKG